MIAVVFVAVPIPTVNFKGPRNQRGPKLFCGMFEKIMSLVQMRLDGAGASCTSDGNMLARQPNQSANRSTANTVQSQLQKARASECPNQSLLKLIGSIISFSLF